VNVRQVRKSIAFLLLGVAETLWPAPGLGTLTNVELDAELARLKRRREAMIC
jgi:hypothetical protein